MLKLIKNIVNFILALILLFFFVYSQLFSFLPVSMGKISILILAPFFLYLIVKRKDVKFNRDSLYILGSIGFLYLYINFISAVKENSETHLPYIFVLEGIEFYLGSFIVAFFMFRWLGISLSNFYIIFSLAVFLQSSFIFLSVLSPSFFRLTLDILPEAGNISAESLKRFRGLTNSSGAGLSMIQTIGVFFSLIVSYYTRNSFVALVFIFLAIITTLSTIFVGRSGLMISFFLLLLFSLFSLFSFRKRKLRIKPRMIRTPVLVFLLFIFMPILAYNSLSSAYKKHIDTYILPKAFEVFINFNKTGNLSSESSDTLLDKMLFLPDSISTFLFGDGKYTDGDSNYMHTDSGYIRLIFAIGAIGSLVYYSYKLFVMKRIVQCHTKLYGKDFVSFSFIFLFLCLLLLEVKEPFLFKGSVSKFLFLLYFMYYFELKSSQNVKINS